MKKFRRALPTLLLLLLFCQIKAQVTPGPIDPGPYGYGSNVTVSIAIPATTCLPRLNNKFELFLSDVTGSFIGERKIGEYNGFYTTFVNGLIPGATPLLLPGDLYRLRIKISGNSTTVDVPGTISIRSVNMPVVGVTPSSTGQVLGTDTYGFCSSSVSESNSIILTNRSAANTRTQLLLTNEIANTSQTYSPGPAGFQITGLPNAYFTALLNGEITSGTETIKSNRSYLLLNSSLKTNIQSPGDGFGCIDPAAGNIATLVYSVNIDGVSGIRNNYPGLTYRIGWGDGTGDVTYTHCELINMNGVITHNYNKTSCGQPPINLGNGNQVTNAFSVSVTAVNPFCAETNSTIAYAKIFVKPVAKITPRALTACTNVPVSFNNGSILGTNANCSTTMQYAWYVDGVLQSTAVDFVYTFTTHGNHEVKLTAKNDVGLCTASENTVTICVQDPPQPSFTLPGAAPFTVCAPGIVSPTNTSVIDNICDQNNTYLWTVTGPAAITYDSGSATSANPVFRMATPGVYQIKLAVTTASCGVFSTTEQTVIVNGQPTVSLSPDVTLCNIGTYNFNSTTTGPTRATFNGTFNAPPGTYKWTVGGGQYTFEDGTDQNSQFPNINFSEFATYTITATHTNSCATVSDTQVITFTPSPQVNAGADQSICFNDASVTLGATISAPVQSAVWVGGSGTFNPDRNAMNAVYTPTPAEKNAGRVTLIFRATTGLAPPCNTIDDEVIITIKPQIVVTSAAAVRLCTGNTLNYQPTATPENTTFTYTATGSANAGGFTSGNVLPVPDILTNSDPVNNATVTYTIIPSNDGCAGSPFTLTVTVTPRPIITAAAASPAICSGSLAGINITSNLSGTTYTWTSTATNGVTGASTMVNPTSSQVINDALFNTGTTSGSVTYTITPISGGCAGNPFDVSVQVDPAVTVSNAGPDESICDAIAYTLNGNQPVVGTGNWTLRSGQAEVTITNSSLYNTTVTGLRGGQTYVFRWTISAPGVCADSFSDVTVTVNVPTLGGTTGTTSATACEGTNTGTIVLSGYTGSILNWESSTDGATWVAVPNTTPSLTYTNLIVTTQFRAVLQNGSCEARASTPTTITVSPATSIANAGPDQILCEGSTVQLNAISALKAGETGRWSVTSATPNAIITDPNNPSTTVTNLTAGQNYNFTWTITGSAPCGPTSDDLTVIYRLPLTNTISSSSTVVCYNQVINITGDTPTGGDGSYSYSWEISSDGTNWLPLTGQTGRDLSYQIQGTSSFRRIVTSNTCSLLSNIIRIITQPPIANNTIAADQNICTGTVPAPLTGSQPTGSDGNFNYQWQASTNNGTTWTDINGAVFPGYGPPALLVTTLYRRIVSTITCNGDLRNISAPVTITIKPNAEAEFTWVTDNGCTPFAITAANVKAVPYPDRNSNYTWYADNVVIGTGITFPGYTITESNQTVTIKLVTVSSLGCTQDEFSHVFSTRQNVTAAFTQSAVSGCGPLRVNFVNTSTSLTAATFRWDFGNGVTSSQTMPPAVTFQPDPTGRDTTYTITLTATTSCGTNSFTSTVFVKARPIAVFSPDRTTGCSPLTVTFTNTSPGGTNTYYYDFGDGTLLTRNDKLPVQHTFTTNVVKDFVVKMIAENECGRDESSYTIRVSPNTVLPELVVNADEKVGCAPFKVNFYNNSRGANLFRYDFGDGSTLLTRSAPEVVSHTFTRPGTYTISLTASNGCSDTTTTESITVLEQPVTAFSADIMLGCPGLPVQFRNTSVGGVSYLWDFGDGTSSIEAEPKHVYTGAQEFYTVSLTATNSLGCTATTTLNQYIHIVPPPLAQFNVAPSTLISIPNYTFRFDDESTNNPTIWAWDFGDGTTSVLPNPSHTYPDTGKYVVTLRVSNQQGCFTTTFKTVTIVGVPGYLYVPNSFMPGGESPELRSFIAKGSGMKTWKLTIFNKWGQTLWETTQLNEGRPVEGWDGTFNSVLQPQGTYFWKIDVEFVNGTEWKGMTYDSKAPKKTGVIHLIR